MDKQERQLKYRVHCREVVLWRAISARELKPLATYRLEVFMRWKEKPSKVTGQEFLNGPLTFLR
jgi:hypothetical protein